jgi:hypothetical protein
VLASEFLLLRFFAFAGESLFFVWPKKSNQKKSHPTKLACGFPALLGSLEGGRKAIARCGIQVLGWEWI